MELRLLGVTSEPKLSVVILVLQTNLFDASAVLVRLHGENGRRAGRSAVTRLAGLSSLESSGEVMVEATPLPRGGDSSLDRLPAPPLIKAEQTVESILGIARDIQNSV